MYCIVFLRSLDALLFSSDVHDQRFVVKKGYD